MPIPKIKLQRLTYTVASAGQEIIIDAETDKLYNTVTRLDVILGDDNAKFSTLQLDINMEEVAPENCEVLRFKFKELSPAGYESQRLNIPAGGSAIKGKYIDKGTGITYPYIVVITLTQENL